MKNRMTDNRRVRKIFSLGAVIYRETNPKKSASRSPEGRVIIFAGGKREAANYFE